MLERVEEEKNCGAWTAGWCVGAGVGGAGRTKIPSSRSEGMSVAVSVLWTSPKVTEAMWKIAEEKQDGERNTRNNEKYPRGSVKRPWLLYLTHVETGRRVVSSRQGGDSNPPASRYADDGHRGL